MRRIPICLGFLAILSWLPAVSRTSTASELFPYDAGIEVLPNGLKVVTVPVNPSKEISYFTIFLAGEGIEVNRGDADEAELLSRIGAEARRIVGGDYVGDFISFCGRENIVDVVHAEAARVLGIAGHEYGGAVSPSPADTILLVTGDINRDELLPLIRSAYGGWTKNSGPGSPAVKTTPSASRPGIPETIGPTRVCLAFRGPDFSDREIDKAALDLFALAAFSPSSPLARKLVLEDGRCLSVRAVFEDRRSAGSFVIQAEASEEQDRPFVEKAIMNELTRLRTAPVSSRFLAEAVSNKKTSLAVSIASTGGMARVLAHYLAMTGDPGTIDRLFALFERITPADVRNAVRKYLGPENLLPEGGKGERR